MTRNGGMTLSGAKLRHLAALPAKREDSGFIEWREEMPLVCAALMRYHPKESAVETWLLR